MRVIQRRLQLDAADRRGLLQRPPARRPPRRGSPRRASPSPDDPAAACGRRHLAFLYRALGRISRARRTLVAPDQEVRDASERRRRAARTTGAPGDRTRQETGHRARSGGAAPSASMLGASGAVTLAACGCGSSRTASASSTTTSTTTGGSTSTTTSGTGVHRLHRDPRRRPPGPYPGDGSNGPDVARRRRRRAFRHPLELRRPVGHRRRCAPHDRAPGGRQRATWCAPLAGAAVYVWHCDRDGSYCLYSRACPTRTTCAACR